MRSKTLVFTNKTHWDCASSFDNLVCRNVLSFSAILWTPGCIVISRFFQIEINESDKTVPNCFSIISGTKTVVVAAASPEEMTKWIEDLNHHITLCKDVSGDYRSISKTASKILNSYNCLSESVFSGAGENRVAYLNDSIPCWVLKGNCVLNMMMVSRVTQKCDFHYLTRIITVDTSTQINVRSNDEDSWNDSWGGENDGKLFSQLQYTAVELWLVTLPEFFFDK